MVVMYFFFLIEKKYFTTIYVLIWGLSYTNGVLTLYCLSEKILLSVENDATMCNSPFHSSGFLLRSQADLHVCLFEFDFQVNY